MIEYKNPASNKTWASWNLKTFKNGKRYTQWITHRPDNSVEITISVWEDADGNSCCWRIAEQQTIITHRGPMLYQ